MNTIDIVPLPAPLPDCFGSRTKYEQEFAAFRQLLPTLMQTHLGRYVAIHNRQVVCHGIDRSQVIHEAFEKVGNVAIHVGLVGSEQAAPARSGVRRDLSNASVPT